MNGNMDAARRIIEEQERAKAEAEAARKAQQAEYSAQAGTAQDASRVDPREQAAAHDELMQMCAEVSLLDLARHDTGETGDNTGDEWRFHSCPVCGHNNDFSVFESTNSWCCYSTDSPAPQNENGRSGGNALDYLVWARHDGDTTAAITELREIAGHPYSPKDKQKDKATDTAQDAGSALLLPQPVAIRASNPPKRSPVLIPGILRRGHVCVLAGKGKTGKSFSAIELCVAVVTCGKWFGWQIDGGGRCLYIDPEIDPRTLDNRFSSVCYEMGADKAAVDSQVVKWSLRGVLKRNGEAPTVADLAHDVGLLYKPGDFALVVIDSASCFVDGDENTAGDVRKFFASVLKITATTGAAVLVVHHFGKARDGDRGAADRARGSSVWLDAPDAALTITEITPPSGDPTEALGAGVYAMALESGGLREFARMEPVHLIFKWPVHIPDYENITTGWLPNSSTRNGGKATGDGNKAKSAERAGKCVTALLAEFVARGTAEGIPATEAAEIVSAAIGETVKAQTLKGYIESADALQVEQVSKQRWQIAPTRKPPEPPPTLDL